jgi:hypothetical protein
MHADQKAFQVAQREDLNLQPYFGAAAGQTVPPHIYDMRPCVNDEGTLFVRIEPDVTRPMVPRAFVRHFCVAAHRAHAGVKSTIWHARQIGWWPTLVNDVTAHVQSCLLCQTTKPIPLNSDMGRPTTDLRRFEELEMDFVPMPPANGYNGFYMIGDKATGMAFAHPTPSHSSSDAIASMERWLAVFDTPKTLRVDGGRELDCDATRAFAAIHGFVIVPNSPHNHGSVGFIEQQQFKLKRQILLDTITKRTGQGSWPDALARALRIVNTTVSTTRGMSAHSLMFGRERPTEALLERIGVPGAPEPAVPTDAAGAALFASDLQARADTAVAAAGANRAKHQAYSAQARARKGAKIDVKVGDHVMIANNDNTEKSKFRNYVRWSGPYKVVALSRRRATLDRVAGGRMRNPHVSVNRLKLIPTSSVVNPHVATGLPGEPTWSGPHDTQLLLDAERKAADLAKAKSPPSPSPSSPPSTSGPALKPADSDAIRRERDNARATAERTRLERVLARDTCAVPDSAVPRGIINMVTGPVLSIDSDPNDRDNPAKRIFISHHHRRFSEFKQLLRQPRANSQPGRRR